ncbi:DUF4189 domain-containing protein [Lysobacter claricitrinus]|uniref:DUF4189 domain-containing protein n=1 Tax=Lysobacter claricitrinus TaxID=3367728 RepID=UPI0037DBF01D
MQKRLTFLLAFGLANIAAAQECPNGIPSANNPSCLPPDIPESPYYAGPAPSAPRAAGYWKDQWGAIAVGTETPDVATVLHMDSETEATEAALRKCRGDEQLSCKTMIAFKNQCGALVWPTLGGHAAAASAPSRTLAERTAIRLCQETGKGCQVVFSDCALAAYRPN